LATSTRIALAIINKAAVQLVAVHGAEGNPVAVHGSERSPFPASLWDQKPLRFSRII